MYRAKALRFLGILVAARLTVAAAGEVPLRYWTDYQVHYDFAERWNVSVEQENWYDTDRLYLEETILLLRYRVCDAFAIAAGDRLVDEKKRADGRHAWHHEHRPTLDLLFHHTVAGWSFDWRNRYEYRLREGADRASVRFRNRVRVRLPWAWTAWQIRPYLSSETYYEARHGLAKNKRFDQHRACAGFTFAPCANVTVSVFYLLMHKQSSHHNWQPLHVPGIEFKVSF